MQMFSINPSAQIVDGDSRIVKESLLQRTGFDKHFLEREQQEEQEVCCRKTFSKGCQSEYLRHKAFYCCHHSEFERQGELFKCEIKIQRSSISSSREILKNSTKNEILHLCVE